MLNTLRNAWKIPDLRKRLIYTLLMLLVIRLGAHIPVPGVNASAIKNLLQQQGGALGLFDMISGGALQNMTIFAISVGVVEGIPLLDLCYEEDSRAEVDMNIVMTDKGEYIEVQGTGEKYPFSYDMLNTLLQLGSKGTKELIEKQKEALGEIAHLIGGSNA